MRKNQEENLEFIALLRNEQPEGWTLFLEQYSQTILRTIHRFSFDYDEIMEIYVYACEKLAENDFFRVKQFRGVGLSGKATFNTWLVSTTINFCRAWVRQKKGRRRLFEAIKNLAELDQKVFDLYYWQNFSENEIIEILNLKHDFRLTPIDVHQSIQRINQALTEKNKWKIVSNLLRNYPTLSLEKLIEEQGDSFINNREYEWNENPEFSFEKKDTESILNKAFQQLTQEERDLLRLRFQKELSAREIGEILKIEKYKKVYSKIDSALGKIKTYLEISGHELGDWNENEVNLHLFQ